MSAWDALGALAELAQDSGPRVRSPCIAVCRMDPQGGLCLGCFRSMDEIIAWGRMGEPEKRLVWQRIAQRAGLEQT